MTESGLVFHRVAMGDFVLSRSIVWAWRGWRPAQRDIAVASAPSARVAAWRSAIDECMSPDAIGVHTLFSQGGELDDRLRSLVGRAAWVLSFLGDETSPSSLALMSIRTRGCFCIDPRPSRQTLARRSHITAQWADDVRRHGAALGALTPPQITIKSDLPAAGRIMIHPGSGGREKCWPFERFIEIADRLGPSRIGWLIGPAELERQPQWVSILRAREAAYDELLIIEADISAAADRISACELYIGNDAGMTQVAAAIGVRTVAIFGPTDPGVWRPPHANVAVVAPPEPAPIGSVSVADVR